MKIRIAHKPVEYVSARTRAAVGRGLVAGRCSRNVHPNFFVSFRSCRVQECRDLLFLAAFGMTSVGGRVPTAFVIRAG